jgi:hypothetical protein
MALDSFAPPVRAGGPSFRAWAYLIAGCSLIIVGAVLSGWENTALSIVRAFLLGGGLLTLGAAAANRLRTASQDFEARIGTASVLLTCGFGVWLASASTPDKVLVPGSVPEPLAMAGINGNTVPPIPDEREWDSVRMAMHVLAGVSLAGALLVVLPIVARKVVISLLIVLHFGNIVTSITSVAPPNSAAPWLPVQLFMHFYRPYASFMYLNNAYHFYSPEPGPPTLAWFYVTYTDGSGRWIKLPSKKDSPVPIHYQRHLALTESLNVINHNTPREYNDLASRRRLAGKIFTPEEITLPPDVAPGVAYQPPEEYTRKMVESYARYVANHWPHPDDNPNAQVKTVKVYRLIHRIISAPELASGLNADDPEMDLPYFMGEFDPTGEMLDEHDPFLYFLLPIQREPKNPDGDLNDPSNVKLRNCLEIHAAGRPENKEPQP